MGGRPPAPRVEYIPAPPPPTTVSTPTQSLKTQVELARVSGEQNRLNMETGAELDRINEEFYTGQDLRRYRARGAEERLLAETRGEQERATIVQQVLRPDVQERLKVLRQDLLEKLKENKEGRLSVKLLKKLERLTCNRSSSDAIKRIEISSKHNQRTNHNRLVRYFI